MECEKNHSSENVALVEAMETLDSQQRQRAKIYIFGKMRQILPLLEGCHVAMVNHLEELSAKVAESNRFDLITPSESDRRLWRQYKFLKEDVLDLMEPEKQNRLPAA
jgi:hypothetical protein